MFIFFIYVLFTQTAANEANTTTTSIPVPTDIKAAGPHPSSSSNTVQQHVVVPTALSRISEDSPRPVVPHRCLNIAGIEKYPELQGALPRAWSVPTLAPHVRSHLEAPLVCIIIYYIL